MSTQAPAVPSLTKGAIGTISFDLLSGVGGEKSAIVLDIGASYTKCGFAGEAAPRHVIPTDLTLKNGKKLSLAPSIGIHNYKNQEWEEALEILLNKVFYRHLQVNPRERRVVICENLYCQDIIKDALKVVLFDKCRCPAIFFCTNQSTCLIPLNNITPTGLVVDFGYHETRVLPVYEGIPLPYSYQASPVGFHAVTRNLDQLLRDYATIFNTQTQETHPIAETVIPQEILEDIAVRACFVDYEKISNLATKKVGKQESDNNSPRTAWPHNPKPLPDTQDSHPPIEPFSKLKVSKSSLNIQHKVTGKSLTVSNDPNSNTNKILKYNLSSTQVLNIPLIVRKGATDVLFEADIELNSIATIILEAVRQSPADTRLELLANIMLIGGGAMMKGLKNRIYAEVKHLIRESQVFEELRALENSISFTKFPFSPSSLAWVGGSVVGALEYSNTNSLTRENYNSAKFKYLMNEPLPPGTTIITTTTTVETTTPVV